MLELNYPKQKLTLEEGRHCNSPIKTGQSNFPSFVHVEQGQDPTDIKMSMLKYEIRIKYSSPYIITRVWDIK